MVPVCMGVEVGLRVPREPVRVVQIDGGHKLVQPATGTDVTENAKAFTDGFLSGLEEVDGFILKSRSPSCGIRDVKVYLLGVKVAALTAKGSGLFAREVIGRFGHLAIEDESRLLNIRIGEHFLTQVFAFAELRGVMKKGRMSELVDFHHVTNCCSCTTARRRWGCSATSWRTGRGGLSGRSVRNMRAISVPLSPGPPGAALA
jgi:uncharacterized protein YbbK (DUF523 family)